MATDVPLPERRAEVITQLVECHGNITRAAEKLSVTRQSLHRFVKDDKELQDLISHCRESMLDKVESVFEMNCLNWGPEFQTSRIFFLKTRGSHRGYKQETNVRISDGRAELVDELVQPGDSPDAAN